MYPLEYDFFPRTWVVPNELNELRLYASARSKSNKTKAQKSRKSSLTLASSRNHYKVSSFPVSSTIGGLKTQRTDRLDSSDADEEMTQL